MEAEMGLVEYIEDWLETATDGQPDVKSTEQVEAPLTEEEWMIEQADLEISDRLVGWEEV